MYFLVSMSTSTSISSDFKNPSVEKSQVNIYEIRMVLTLIGIVEGLLEADQSHALNMQLLALFLELLLLHSVVSGITGHSLQLLLLVEDLEILFDLVDIDLEEQAHEEVWVDVKLVKKQDTPCNLGEEERVLHAHVACLMVVVDLLQVVLGRASYRVIHDRKEVAC